MIEDIGRYAYLLKRSVDLDKFWEQGFFFTWKIYFFVIHHSCFPLLPAILVFLSSPVHSCFENHKYHLFDNVFTMSLMGLY